MRCSILLVCLASILSASSSRVQAQQQGKCSPTGSSEHFTGTYQLIASASSLVPYLLLPSGDTKALVFPFPPLGLQPGVNLIVYGLDTPDDTLAVECYEVLTASSRRSLQGGRPAMPIPGQTYIFKSIVYVYTICGQGPPGGPDAAAQVAKRLMFTDSYSLKNNWDTCGHGNVMIRPEDTLILTVDIPCGVSSPTGGSIQRPTGGSGCSWDDAIRARGWADAYAKDTLNINTADYYHRINLMPEVCENMALGTQGCGPNPNGWCDVALAGFSAWTDAGAYIHEVGHTLGLAHAASPTDNFGDTSDPMGWCCGGKKCYNAPHLYALGWNQPMADLDGNSFQAGRWYSYSIPELSTAPSSHIRLTPSWSGSSPKYFLSYRAPYGFDTGLLPEWTDQVQVHTYTGGFMPNLVTERPVIIGKLSSGDTYKDNDIQLVVKFSSTLKGGSSASVSICRWASGSERGSAACNDGLDNDCNGLIDAEEPGCKGDALPRSPTYLSPRLSPPPNSPKPKPSPRAGPPKFRKPPPPKRRSRPPRSPRGPSSPRPPRPPPRPRVSRG